MAIFKGGAKSGGQGTKFKGAKERVLKQALSLLLFSFIKNRNKGFQYT